MLKVGVYLETSYDIISEKLYCEDVYTLLLNELSNSFKFCFLGRLKDNEIPRSFYKVNHSAKFYEIEKYKNLNSLIIQFPFYLKRNYSQINQFVLENDRLLIMTPSPISIVLIKLAIKHNKKVCVLVRQDIKKMLSSRFSGFKKIIALLISGYMENSVKKLIENKNLCVLTLGDKLYKDYSKHTDIIFRFASSRYKYSNIVVQDSIKPFVGKNIIKLLFVGRIESNKGLQDLLIALTQIKEGFNLTVVGDGSYLNDVKDLIKDFGLEKNVNLVGYIPFGPKLLDIYRSHDIFVLPSYSEGFPQVILEAMASCCLVLSTDVGSIPTIVSHGKTGFLFKPKDVNALKNLLVSVLKGNYDIDEIRNNALIIAKEYTFENQSKILIKALS